MKRILIYLVPLFLSGCIELELDPADAIPAEQAFQDQKTVDAVLIGVYDGLQSGAITQDYTLFAGLAADNLTSIGSKIEYREVFNNRINAFNVDIEGIWNSHYDVINRANQLIANLEGNQNFNEAFRNSRLGQARFIRAFSYLNLVRMFGALPYRTEPSTSIEPEKVNQPRLAAAEVYQRIVQDLQQAETELSGTGRGSGIFRVSEMAVKALLARTYLYQQNYQQAASKAAEVIAGGYQLAPGDRYLSIFLETESTDEIIFSIDYVSDQARNTLAEYTQPTARFEVGLTQEAYNEYNPADVRRGTVVRQNGNILYLNKYNDIINQSDNLIILRLAEMYLIRAEALNALGYQPDGTAFDALNAVRTRAGLEALEGADLPNQNAFALAVAEERRRELIGEGHRWFDLIRNNRALAELQEKNTITSQNQLLFPIPQSEIDTNQHPEMQQNPGY